MPRLLTNRVKFARPLTVEDVTDADSLVEYAHYILGTPYPNAKERVALNSILKQFFKDYPDANFRCLTDVVTWAKARNKHFDVAKLFGCYRYAYQDGFMSILEAGGSTNDDATLARLLENVDDPHVRSRMIAAASSTTRDEIYEHYLSSRETEDRNGSKNLPHLTPPYLADLGLREGEVVCFKVSLSDPLKYGTVVGHTDTKVLVYSSGEELPLSPHMVYQRKDGAWQPLSS